LTIPETLAAIARERPDQLAVVYRDTRLTYADLDRLVSRVARGVSELGAGPGARVALMGPNNHLYVAAYMGIMRAVMPPPMVWSKAARGTGSNSARASR